MPRISDLIVRVAYMLVEHLPPDPVGGSLERFKVATRAANGTCFRRWLASEFR